MKLGFKKTIKVTKKDIAQGIPDDPAYCPVAYALRRTLKLDDDESVEVDLHSVSLPGHELNIPAKATKFIEKFDDSKFVGGKCIDPKSLPKPFEFTLKF